MSQAKREIEKQLEKNHEKRGDENGDEWTLRPYRGEGKCQYCDRTIPNGEEVYVLTTGQDEGDDDPTELDGSALCEGCMELHESFVHSANKDD